MFGVVISIWSISLNMIKDSARVEVSAAPVDPADQLIELINYFIPSYPLISIIIGILGFGYLSRKKYFSSLAV